MPSHGKSNHLKLLRKSMYRNSKETSLKNQSNPTKILRSNKLHKHLQQPLQLFNQHKSYLATKFTTVVDISAAAYSKRKNAYRAWSQLACKLIRQKVYMQIKTICAIFASQASWAVILASNLSADMFSMQSVSRI